MKLEKAYVCTSKNAKLFNLYLLQTDDSVKRSIYNEINEDVQSNMRDEVTMEEINGSALIEDIPYYISFDKIDQSSYLFEFKEKVLELLNNPQKDVINFGKIVRNNIKNFEENEGIKFLVLKEEKSLYFIYISQRSIIKHKSILNITDINNNSTLIEVPKGIQIPNSVTARYDINSRNLYVYNVNNFENMLAMNENRKAKANKVINDFVSGENKISKQGYKVIGLEADKVKQKLFSSSRSLRRLSKYDDTQSDYTIIQIKSAVNKLDDELQVKFDDERKEININEDNVKTFVGIIHNIIVERLISGDIEITI